MLFSSLLYLLQQELMGKREIARIYIRNKSFLKIHHHNRSYGGPIGAKPLPDKALAVPE